MCPANHPFDHYIKLSDEIMLLQTILAMDLITLLTGVNRRNLMVGWLFQPLLIGQWLISFASIYR